MFPYVLLLGIPLLFSFLAKQSVVRLGRREIRFDLSLFLFFALFVAIVSCRHISIGNDTANYAEIYDISRWLGWSNVRNGEFEPGYLLFSKVLYELGFNYQWFLFAVALCSALPVYLYYREASDDTLLTICLFVAIAPFSMYFSGLRQVLAMGLSVPAFSFAQKKNPIGFFAMLLLAISFHTSAFVLILLFPVCFFKVTKKWLWGVIPLFLLVVVFNKPIFLFLISRFGQLYSGEITETGAYTTLMLLIVFTVFCFVIPDEQQMDNETIALRNVLLIALFLQPFATINLLAMRFNYYFLIFIPVLIPRIIQRCKPQYETLCRVAAWVMMIAFIVYFYINLSEGGGLNIYPYVPFWSKV